MAEITKLTDAEITQIVNDTASGDPLETEHYEKDKSKDVPVGAKIDKSSKESEYDCIVLKSTGTTVFGIKVDKIEVDDKDKPIEDGKKFKKVKVSRVKITPAGGEMIEISKRTVNEVAVKISELFSSKGLNASVSGKTLPTRPTAYLKDVNETIEVGGEITLVEKRGKTFIEINSEGDFDKIKAITDAVIGKVQTAFNNIQAQVDALSGPVQPVP